MRFASSKRVMMRADVHSTQSTSGIEVLFETVLTPLARAVN